MSYDSWKLASPDDEAVRFLPCDWERRLEDEERDADLEAFELTCRPLELDDLEALVPAGGRR